MPMEILVAGIVIVLMAGAAMLWKKRKARSARQAAEHINAPVEEVKLPKGAFCVLTTEGCRSSSIPKDD